MFNSNNFWKDFLAVDSGRQENRPPCLAVPLSMCLWYTYSIDYDVGCDMQTSHPLKNKDLIVDYKLMDPLQPVKVGAVYYRRSNPPESD